MILLDTHVLSEFMRPTPAPEVVAWLNAQAFDRVWISAITRAEIELGMALLPAGKRKQGLISAANDMFIEDFAGRCLAFDDRAAVYYANLVASRSRNGRPISMEDAQIAAIALTHGLTLATRNTADFSAIEGLTLLNPWQLES